VSEHTGEWTEATDRTFEAIVLDWSVTAALPPTAGLRRRVEALCHRSAPRRTNLGSVADSTMT
jgi:hypothetical protein